jgi:sugar lactone lactonase YvrE
MAESGYKLVRTLAGKGTAPHQFADAVRGIAAGRQGQLLAAGDSEVKVFDAAGALGTRWKTELAPLSVAVAPNGTVWTGEAGQIEIFDRAGKRLGVWRDAQKLGRVTAIGFAGEHVLAADASDRAIRRLDRSGRWVNDIGKNNNVNGLLIPNGAVSFAVDERGVIHAANPGKHRVEQYLPDGSLLGHIGRFGQNDAAGFPGCCNPTNVAVQGAIYVTEKAGPRAKVYDLSGKLLAVIATAPFDPNCRNMAIAAAPRGRVWVADTVKLAIFEFAPAGGAQS